jgi:ABC-2 type transporter
MTIAFNSIQNIILIFPDERPVFLREVGNNMYSVSAYFFGKVLAELPASIITPIVYGCIVYFSIGLSTVFAWKFPLFCKINDCSNFISGYIDPYLQHSWFLRSDHFHTFLRQVDGCDTDTSADHSIHAVRRFLRESGQYPNLVD